MADMRLTRGGHQPAQNGAGRARTPSDTMVGRTKPMRRNDHDPHNNRGFDAESTIPEALTDAPHVLVSSETHDHAARAHLPDPDSLGQSRCGHVSAASATVSIVAPTPLDAERLCELCDPRAPTRAGKKPETLIAQVVGEDRARELIADGGES